MTTNFRFLSFALTGALAALISGCTQAIFDTPMGLSQREVTVTTTEKDGSANYTVEYGPVNRGGTTTFSHKYEANDPERGFIIPVDGSTVKVYAVRENNQDHRLVLANETSVTMDLKVEYTLVEAPDNQFAMFIKHATETGALQNAGPTQLHFLKMNDTLWQRTCEVPLSSAVRTELGRIEDYPSFRSKWQGTRNEQGMTPLEQLALREINNLMNISANCPYRLTRVTISNIQPDQKTRDLLMEMAQAQARTKAVGSTMQRYQELKKRYPAEDHSFLQGLMLGNGGEVNLHLK